MFQTKEEGRGPPTSRNTNEYSLFLIQALLDLHTQKERVLKGAHLPMAPHEKIFTVTRRNTQTREEQHQR